MATISQKHKKASSKPSKSRPEATSALSQPVPADSPSLAALSGFSPDGQLFALLSLAVDKHRLRVFDVVTGTVIGEQLLQTSSVSCLQWTKIASQDAARPASPSKKRKRATQEPESPSSGSLITVVLLGLANGNMIFFSPSRAANIFSLSHPSSNAAILSVAIEEDGTRAWASCANGSIQLWELQSNTVLASWKTPSKIPYGYISLRPKEPMDIETPRQILAANHAIELIELAEGTSKPKVLGTFTGHTTRITSLRWLSSSPNLHFVTSSERDRFVQGWTLSPGKSAGSISFSASVDGDVRGFHTTQDGSMLLVAAASGTLFLYAIPLDPSPSPLEPQSIITFGSKKGVEGSSTLDAIFSPSLDGNVQVTRLLEGVRPGFQTVRYTDDNGSILESVKVKSSSPIKSQKTDKLLSTGRYKESEKLHLGNGIIAAMGDTDFPMDTGALDTDMAELSLGQRLKAKTGEDAILPDSDSEPENQEKRRKSTMSATKEVVEVPTESLSRTLIQALHSSDTKLLEGCLRHSDPKLIRNTVMRLPSQLALPLVQVCVDRLARGRGGNTGKFRGSAASSQRGAAMIAWLRVVLVVHSSHLMTMPNLVSRLAALHATLTTRMAMHERLIMLNGRLDFALTQVELRSAKTPSKLANKQSKGDESESKEVSRYVEGESSDDQEMEVQVDKDTDDEDIEEIGLGGQNGEDSVSQSDDSQEGTDDVEDDNKEASSEEDEEDDVSDDDEDEDEEGPRMNGLIDDEAEESWGDDSEEEEEEEE